jgi:hypothetical protein
LIVPLTHDLTGYSGVAHLAAFKAGLAWKGDILVRLEQFGNQANLVVAGGHEQYRRVASVLGWSRGLTKSFAEQFADKAIADDRPASGGFAYIAKLAGLGLVALGLIVSIFQLTSQRSMNATSQMAFVAVPGMELDSHTAGQLVYVKDPGKIDKGEFFAALRTSQDFAKFLEASQGGQISAQAVMPQDYVRKGTPVVRLSSKDAKPYVAAFVKLEDAVTALGAAEAQIEFPSSGRHISVPVDPTSYVNSTQVFTDEGGKALAQINLRIPDGMHLPADEPVIVRFQKPVWSSSMTSPQWLKTISWRLS